MKRDIPPTRSAALDIARDLSFAEEGHDLLEQKRQILVLELMQYVEAAKREQAEADERLARAHAALREAAARVGSQAMARDAMAVPVTQAVEVSERRVMGISVPQVTTEPVEPAPSFGFAGGTLKADEALAAFSSALEAIARLAETQNAVFRLARELRKTQRRVNALDRIFIPDNRETLDYIQSVLEERERDAFVILRIIRDRQRSERTGSEAR
jgi:V/A-type H+-transporting ATPase subunit D